MKPPPRFVCFNRQLDEENHMFSKKIDRSWRLRSANHPTQDNKNDGTIYGSRMFLMDLMVFLMVFQLFSWCFLWFLVV